MLPWVEPEFIKAHVESLYASDVIGLAIRRIEGNELPRLWKEETKPSKIDSHASFVCPECHCRPCSCDDHADDCDCISCQKHYPDRFCKGIEKNGRDGWRECGALVVPGEKYCERHR